MHPHRALRRLRALLRAPRSRLGALAAAAWLASVGIAAGACGKDSQPGLPNRQDQPSAPALAKWIDLWIPPGATAFRSYAEAWQDWRVIAQFDLTASELSTFIERNHLQPAGSAAAPQAPLQQAWFTPPAAARAYRPGTDASDGATTSRFSKALWIHAHGDGATVYLHAADS
jgi:hypothetical protein